MSCMKWFQSQRETAHTMVVSALGSHAFNFSTKEDAAMTWLGYKDYKVGGNSNLEDCSWRFGGDHCMSVFVETASPILF